MLNNIENIFASMAPGLLKIFQGALIFSIKIEILKLYLELVEIARNIAIVMLTSIAMLLLAMIAFVMIHVGILIFLPYSLEAKGWIILLLGIIYGLISYTVIKNMCSEKTWLQISKSAEMMNGIMNNKGDKKD
ncbi:MAG: hypothetical protein HQK76_03040 [Desulfobacterales bacterium]|nr:hypothetical protein [Desulfobacterales bacterium]